MQLIINVAKLLTYAQQHLKTLGELQTLELRQLTSGITRVDLTLRLVTDDQATLSFAHKRTYRRREIRVLQALGELTSVSALPQLIDAAFDPAASDDSTNDQASHWFVTPFYPGSTLTFVDEVPPTIIDALAQVHAHFAARVAEFDYLERIDAAFFRRTFDNALTILAKALQEKPHPIFAEAQRALTTARANKQLYQALAALPLTLTHGDVHPGNMLITPTGQAMLIDWGNACLAPAMLDLANMVALDSPNWLRYLTAVEQARGAPLEQDLSRLGHDWATVMINTFYLPYAVDFMPLEHVQGMVVRLVQAEQRISEALN